MAAILDFYVPWHVRMWKIIAEMSSLTPKTLYMHVLWQKCDDPEIFKISSFSSAAILKKGRQKFSPHFSEVHGGQIFYLAPKDDKTTKKPSSGLHDHRT